MALALSLLLQSPLGIELLLRTGPQVLPTQSHQQDQQAPQMQQYLSASTAKGMMLRNELQSMMAMPQGAAPAPVNAPGYVQQVYYGPGAVVCSYSGSVHLLGF